jgi:hypothetical protein
MNWDDPADVRRFLRELRVARTICTNFENEVFWIWIGKNNKFKTVEDIFHPHDE